MEDQQLNDHDRSEKNLRDIDQAINSDLKYDVVDPIVSSDVAFGYDSQYKGIADRILEFGAITGVMKPPEMSVTKIKFDRCTVKVRPHADSKGSRLKFERNEVRYGPIGGNGDDEKANGDDDEKQANDSCDAMKVVEIGKAEGEVVISGLRAETQYGFRVRACYEQIGFTNYSDTVTVSTQKSLNWDRNRHGNGLVFVNDQRVKFPSTSCIALANYVVRREEHEAFEWTVQVHQWSNHSWIGFVNAVNIDQKDLNEYVGNDGQHDGSVGAGLGRTQLNYCGTCAVSSPNRTVSATKAGDVFKFVVDYRTNQMTLHHNEISLGVYWENLYDAFIPAASNHRAPAEYTICGSVPV